MLICKKIISLSIIALLSLITNTANTLQNNQLNHHEYLDIYDLCLKFEQAYNNICFHGSISFNTNNNHLIISDVTVSHELVHEAASLIKEVKKIKEDKEAFLHSSQEQLEEIKIRLITTLQELELLKKSALEKQTFHPLLQKKSVYKEWAKATFKVVLNGFIVNTVVKDIQIIQLPLVIIQAYLLFGFGKATFNVLLDITEKVFHKIW